MSENVSYSVAAMAGGAVRKVLGLLGVFFHDSAAWQTAEERAESLRNALKRGLDAMDRKLEEGGCRHEANRLDCMLAAFNSVPAFKSLAEQARPDELDRLKSEIAVLYKRSSTGESSRALMRNVLEAQARLEVFTASVQKDLCMAEKKALLTTMASTLTDMGYLVELKGAALKATRNQTGVWAVAGDHGQLAVDFSGLSGLTCMTEMARIEERLGRRGVSLRTTGKSPHGRLEGGALVKTLRPLFPEYRNVGARKNPFTPVHKLIRKRANLTS